MKQSARKAMEEYFRVKEPTRGKRRPKDKERGKKRD